MSTPTLYRAVPIGTLDPNQRLLRQPTPRLPMNVPYVVDNVWEFLRPEHMPSRRHAAYASPTPELALANASAGGVSREDYEVGILEIVGEYKVAQLRVSDARHHHDLRVLQRLFHSILGDNPSMLSRQRKSEVAEVWMPGLCKEDALELSQRVDSIANAFSTAKVVSAFWRDASTGIQTDTHGEVFFELVGDAYYRLIPINM